MSSLRTDCKKYDIMIAARWRVPKSYARSWLLQQQPWQQLLMTTTELYLTL